MKTKYLFLIVSAIVFLFSCDDDKVSDFTFPPQGVSLKDAALTASFPVGVGIGYAEYMNNPKYAAAVNLNFDNVSFEYQMKHAAMVNINGNLDFTKSDALYNQVTANGLKVFGHCLIWHKNNNGDYLRSLVWNDSTASVTANLIKNGGFELGTGNDFTNWRKFNGAANFFEGKGASEVKSGTRSLKIVVTTAGQAWSTQIVSDPFLVEPNKLYKVSLSVKSLASGGIGRISTQEAVAQYFSDFTTTDDWSTFSYTFKTPDTSVAIAFDMGRSVNTYFIDDVSVVEVVDDAPGEHAFADSVAIDGAMKKWITEMVGHYKGKVKAWDVVNEPMADGSSGLLKNTAKTTGDIFYWQQYLGRNYAVNAFKYAKAADPDALLFINEYNLESNSVKLDSLINYVKELQAKGAHIDGIGTQMHINWNSDYVGIERMFQKLAATGLKIRISELDIKLNAGKNKTYPLTEEMLNYQAAMYQFVVESYKRNIPEAQRHGITVWNVADNDSWLVVNQKEGEKYPEYPCLFDAEYNKKPAYYGFLQGLQK